MGRSGGGEFKWGILTKSNTNNTLIPSPCAQTYGKLRKRYSPPKEKLNTIKISYTWRRRASFWCENYMYIWPPFSIEFDKMVFKVWNSHLFRVLSLTLTWYRHRTATKGNITYMSQIELLFPQIVFDLQMLLLLPLLHKWVLTNSVLLIAAGTSLVFLAPYCVITNTPEWILKLPKVPRHRLRRTSVSEHYSSVMHLVSFMLTTATTTIMTGKVRFPRRRVEKEFLYSNL